MLLPAVADSRGSSLAIAIVLLTLLATVGVAIIEVSRFGQLAAQAQLSAAAAMYLADMGLDYYETGTTAALEPIQLESSSGEVTVTATQLLRMRDSTVIVLVESRGTASVGTQATGRRTLQVMVRIEPTGVRRRVRGTLAEEF